MQELFRSHTAPGHPRSEMIREQATTPEGITLWQSVFVDSHCKFRVLIM
jgi:hypothetical protein